MLEEFDLALDLAGRNYNKFPDNIFNIYQYFNCLIREKTHNLEKIHELLDKAREVDRLPTSSKQFYATMKSLYERFVEHNYLKAIEILNDNKVHFENLIYYYRDLFDLYIEIKDINKMESTLSELKKAIGENDNYLPLLIRRECILLYFKNHSLSLVNQKLLITNSISNGTKTKIIEYIKSLELT